MFSVKIVNRLYKIKNNKNLQILTLLTMFAVLIGYK